MTGWQRIRMVAVLFWAGALVLVVMLMVATARGTSQERVFLAMLICVLVGMLGLMVAGALREQERRLDRVEKELRERARFRTLGAKVEQALEEQESEGMGSEEWSGENGGAKMSGEG